MSHPIPKELKGEERFFYIKELNIYLNKKGVIYDGTATLLAVALGKLFGLPVFVIFFLLLNGIAYPLAQMRVPKSKFEGGNVPLDIFCLRLIRYKFFSRNIYARRRNTDG